MPICLRCGENFTESLFKRHIRRTRVICEAKVLDISYQEMKDNYDECYDKYKFKTERYSCEDCGKSYAHSSGLYRHRKTCASKSQRLLREEIIMIREELKELRSVVSQQVNIDTSSSDHIVNDNIVINANDNSNRTQNNSFNINLDPFGREDISHITDDDWNKVIKLRYNGIREFVKLLYYGNPKNLNVFFPNKSRKSGYVFKPPHWNPKNSKEISEIVVQNTADQISDYMEGNPDKVSSADYFEMDKVLNKIQKDAGENCKQREEVLDLLYENRFRNEVWKNYAEKSKGDKIIPPLVMD